MFWESSSESDQDGSDAVVQEIPLPSLEYTAPGSFFGSESESSRQADEDYPIMHENVYQEDDSGWDDYFDYMDQPETDPYDSA